MVFHLSEALGRIKRNLAELLERETILECCREVGHTWRDRLFDPVTTLHLFILQVLHRNTACTHLPHLSDLSFTSSAYCQARKRLPLAILGKLLAKMIHAVRPGADTGDSWHGHRTFLVDGSSFSMSDTSELRGYFGQPSEQKSGCGFPVAHLLAMFHVGTGMLIEAIAAPMTTHDLSQMPLLHPRLEPGDLLVADRGFCSFAHLAILRDRLLHAVFRIHHRMFVDFTPGRPHGRGTKGIPTSRWLRQLGVTDQLVEWFKPEQRPKWMTAEQFAILPESIVVRELRYTVNRPGFRTKEVTLATTLLDAQMYPAEELANLYRTRWRIEVELKNLKQTMNMDILHCKTVEGVQKELAVFALVYNLVRVVMLTAAGRQGVPVERISFIDAVRWLSHAKPGKRLGNLVVLPIRPDRVEPRVRKRRSKNYRLMRESREILKARLLGEIPAR
ncbi:MAG: IS4 family transposase [Planctomycetota bacterium]